MTQKNRLTKRKNSTMVKNMGNKLAKGKIAPNLVDMMQFRGERYCVVPEKEYTGLLETVRIMSDPEAYKRLKEAFADPVKKKFSSIEEIRKDLESDDDWE
jgi:hypothetical protein